MTIIKNIEQFSRILLPLILVSILFLLKGISYVFIGSYIPFTLSLIFLYAILQILRNVTKTSRRLIRLLGVSLILWGSIRLLVELLFTITPVTEAHIRDQFSIVSKTISLLAIIFGIYSFRKARTYISSEG